MADNVPITAGVGTDVATDDVGAVHYQRMKLDVGGNGVAQPVEDGAGAGMVPCGGRSDVVSVTLTRPANTTAYASGDEVTDTGGAVRELTGIARISGGSGIIQGVSVAVSSNWVTRPLMELWVFDTTTAPATDNAAFDVDDTEINTLIGVLQVSMDFTGDPTANTGNFVMDTGQISVPFKCVGSANLFMRVVVRNAAQAGANSDTLKFRFRVLMD
jgi:hypothetical protein